MARLNKHARRRGTVLVETALILPLLLLLTFGLLEYGWMFLKIQQLNSAAREGVRVGVRADGTNAMVNAAVDAAMTLAGMSGSGYTVEITPSAEDAVAGTTLKVSVTVPYNTDDGLKLIGFPGVPLPDNLYGEYYMMKEGP